MREFVSMRHTDNNIYVFVQKHTFIVADSQRRNIYKDGYSIGLSTPLYQG